MVVVITVIISLVFYQVHKRRYVGRSLAYTVNPEIFARILFSRIALKDILATGKFRDYSMIYLILYQ